MCVKRRRRDTQTVEKDTPRETQFTENKYYSTVATFLRPDTRLRMSLRRRRKSVTLPFSSTPRNQQRPLPPVTLTVTMGSSTAQWPQTVAYSLTASMK
ncbi:hypothetical protein AGIG_G23418 [Arapaima gigas]